MFRLPESYDRWRLQSPPRFEDGPDPEPDPVPDHEVDGDDTSEFSEGIEPDTGGEG